MDQIIVLFPNDLFTSGLGGIKSKKLVLRFCVISYSWASPMVPYTDEGGPSCASF